ncbi:carboxylating nicotinate-nucleotide diphosphorylase [Modicisalibacter coralii]|uniref:carboxylating nicotinate-nucleotide diphosphorylase n=1 Tax=Modicisalibacter coralii TaxID=2304602 RepID=UPI00100AC867|nr:carboxylating nicotinate-nucleotide diphosphorylase [Halomonas coralii]
MYEIDKEALARAIHDNVAAALLEDIGSGDITSHLIPENIHAEATVTTRERAVMCGSRWVDEVFREIDQGVKIEWVASDGDMVEANTPLCHLSGSARSLLSGERSALNFLQLLMGIATRCHAYSTLVGNTHAKLLDTRKTLPGLRLAQKYAVTCGGCHSHRTGLYDGFLIKENHIMSCGGISEAITAARQTGLEAPIEIEVENLSELKQALAAKADIIMLDNFTLDDMYSAVQLNNGSAVLEASGGITENTLADIAQTGVDYISLGTLTKDVKAADLSMRLSL